MDIPTKNEIFGQYAYRDPVVHLCFVQQGNLGLSDDEFYRMLIAELLDRHQHMDRQLTNLLKQIPQRMFVNTTI